MRVTWRAAKEVAPGVFVVSTHRAPWRGVAIRVQDGNATVLQLRDRLGKETKPQLHELPVSELKPCEPFELSEREYRRLEQLFGGSS